MVVVEIHKSSYGDTAEENSKMYVIEHISVLSQTSPSHTFRYVHLQVHNVTELNVLGITIHNVLGITIHILETLLDLALLSLCHR